MIIKSIGTIILISFGVASAHANESSNAVMVNIEPTQQYIDVTNKNERAKAALALHAYINRTFTLPTKPSQQLMNKYQQLDDAYGAALLNSPSNQDLIRYATLQDEPAAAAILRFHSRRNMLDATSCLKLTASLSRSEEYRCYAHSQLTLLSDLGWVRHSLKQRADDAKLEFTATMLLATSDSMSYLLAGASGFAKEYQEARTATGCAGIPKKYTGICKPN